MRRKEQESHCGRDHGRPDLVLEVELQTTDVSHIIPEGNVHFEKCLITLAKLNKQVELLLNFQPGVSLRVDTSQCPWLMPES